MWFDFLSLGKPLNMLARILSRRFGIDDRGILDDEYVDYVVAMLRKCKDHGLLVFIDPHQDVVNTIRQARLNEVVTILGWLWRPFMDSVRLRIRSHKFYNHRGRSNTKLVERSPELSKNDLEHEYV